MFAHAVAGGAHGVDDIVCDAFAADVAERAGEAPGDRAVAALEEAVHHVRSIRIVASAVRASVGLRSKNAGELAISAAGNENKPQPVFYLNVLFLGTVARMSNSDVPWGSAVALLPPLEARTTSWGGTARLPACRDNDCSGERHHSLPKRSRR